MAVRTPALINQLFHDESIAVQFIFKVYNIIYFESMANSTYYVELAMDSMEHMINWRWVVISRIFCDLFRYFYFKNNVVEIVHKISTLHIHIRGTDCLQSFSLWISGPWKKRACRGPATITRLPSLFINQFFHNIKLLQPYDVCRHQPEPFYGPDCYICEH